MDLGRAGAHQRSLRRVKGMDAFRGGVLGHGITLRYSEKCVPRATSLTPSYALFSFELRRPISPKFQVKVCFALRAIEYIVSRIMQELVNMALASNKLFGT